MKKSGYITSSSNLIYSQRYYQHLRWIYNGIKKNLLL